MSTQPGPAAGKAAQQGPAMENLYPANWAPPAKALLPAAKAYVRDDVMYIYSVT